MGRAQGRHRLRQADRQTGQVVANRATPAEWEAFRIVEYAPGKTALMASDGGYLWAENGGGGIVNGGGTRIDDASTFA